MKVFGGILITTFIMSILGSIYMVRCRKFFAGAIMQEDIGKILPKPLIGIMCTIATWFWLTIMTLTIIVIARLIHLTA